MKTIQQSRHFVPWEDPASGVRSYLLQTDLAPFAQTFYFVNNSTTRDGRYFWFYCAFPPMGLGEGSAKTVAVLDLVTDQLHHYPNIQPSGTPLIDEQTGEIFWCQGRVIFRKGPQPQDEVRVVARIPEQYVGSRLAGHMTFSPDKRYLCIEPQKGLDSYLGAVSVETGELELWDHRQGGWTHAQLNPVVPDTVLYAMDFYTDCRNGEKHIISWDEEGRLQRSFIKRKGHAPQVIPTLYYEASHEWWSADGQKVFYCDWIKGIVRYDTRTGQSDLVMPYGVRHGYATADEQYFVGDRFLDLDGKGWYRGCATSVTFYNRITDRYAQVLTQSPALYTRENPCVYHIDAHPRFVFGERYLAYTTTVQNRVSVAFTDMAQLLERTKG